MSHNNYKKTILDNGLRLVSERMDYARSVCIGIWVDVGSRDERPEENGISHLIEHMSFKGTKNRSAIQIAKELDAIGGMSNAFTGRENTCFHARVLARHFSVAADILSDIFLNSVYDPREIEKEKWVILQEIRTQEDSPEEHVHDLLFRIFWKDHPIGMPILGTEDTVKRIEREDILNYLSLHYCPKDIVIAASGAIDHENFVDFFSPHFEKLSCLDNDPKRIPPKSNKDISLNQKELEQVHICLGVESISIKDNRRFALSILNTIFGGNMSSRLFQEIRENKGIAYSVYSFVSSYTDAGILGIYVACDPIHVNSVLEVINKEIKRLLKGDISKEDVSSAKEYLIGGIYLSSESIENRMFRIARNELIFGRYIPYEETISWIEAVSLDDVVDMAEFLFKDKEATAVILGPLREKIDISLIKWG